MSYRRRIYSPKSYYEAPSTSSTGAQYGGYKKNAPSTSSTGAQYGGYKKNAPSTSSTGAQYGGYKTNVTWPSTSSTGAALYGGFKTTVPSPSTSSTGAQYGGFKTTVTRPSTSSTGAALYGGFQTTVPSPSTSSTGAQYGGFKTTARSEMTKPKPATTKEGASAILLTTTKTPSFTSSFGKLAINSSSPPPRVQTSQETCKYTSLELIMVREMAKVKGIPLCLPNNIIWDPFTGKSHKKNEPRSSLCPVPAAIELLNEIKEPVCVVAIAGPCRDGKSYILGEVFGQKDVFSIGHEMDPETMGLWMWVVPQKFKDSSGHDFTVILLDSEGINAVMAEGLNDNQIFTLTVLLASVLIYNSKGVPKRSDLNDLSFIVKLSQRIRIRSKGGRDDQDSFRNTFPFFIWLLRDVAQKLPKDCRDLNHYFSTRVFKGTSNTSSDEKNQQMVTESILKFFSGFEAFSLPSPSSDEDIMQDISQFWDKLNPKFRDGVKNFESVLKSKLEPKQSVNKGEKITGEAVGVLVKLYTDAINAPDAVPNVETAWHTFVTTKCSDARREALKLYDEVMGRQLTYALPCDGGRILENHENAQSQSMKKFQVETSGLLSTNIGKGLLQLMTSFDEKLTDWRDKNATRTQTFCQNLLETLKSQHLDPVFTKMRGRFGYRVRYSDITAGLNAIEDNFHRRAIGDKHVRADVFYKFNKRLRGEVTKYKDILVRMEDYDKELARTAEEVAFQEKEKRRLEEDIAIVGQREKSLQRKIVMMENKSEREVREMRQQARTEKIRLQNQMKMMEEAGIQQKLHFQQQLDAAASRERFDSLSLTYLQRDLKKERENARAERIRFDQEKQWYMQKAKDTQIDLQYQIDSFKQRERQSNNTMYDLKAQIDNEKSRLASLQNERQSLQMQLDDANKPGFFRSLWKKIW